MHASAIYDFANILLVLLVLKASISDWAALTLLYSRIHHFFRYHLCPPEGHPSSLSCQLRYVAEKASDFEKLDTEVDDCYGFSLEL